MFTVTTSPTSVRVRENKTNQSIALVLRNEQIEFHQMMDGKQSKAITDLQKEIKSLVKEKLPKKYSYKQRFATVATMLKKCEGANTFMVLKKRLNEMTTGLV